MTDAEKAFRKRMYELMKEDADKDIKRIEEIEEEKKKVDIGSEARRFLNAEEAYLLRKGSLAPLAFEAFENAMTPRFL